MNACWLGRRTEPSSQHHGQDRPRPSHRRRSDGRRTSREQHVTMEARGSHSHNRDSIVVEDGRDVFRGELVRRVADEKTRLAHSTVTNDNAPRRDCSAVSQSRWTGSGLPCVGGHRRRESTRAVARLLARPTPPLSSVNGRTSVRRFNRGEAVRREGGAEFGDGRARGERRPRDRRT